MLRLSWILLCVPWKIGTDWMYSLFFFPTDRKSSGWKCFEHTLALFLGFHPGSRQQALTHNSKIESSSFFGKECRLPEYWSPHQLTAQVNGIFLKFSQIWKWLNIYPFPAPVSVPRRHFKKGPLRGSFQVFLVVHF